MVTARVSLFFPGKLDFHHWEYNASESTQAEILNLEPFILLQVAHLRNHTVISDIIKYFNI